MISEKSLNKCDSARTGLVMRHGSFDDSALYENSFTYLLLYLFTSLRTGPFRFQAGGRKRRRNLALVFCVYFVL